MFTQLYVNTGNVFCFLNNALRPYAHSLILTIYFIYFNPRPYWRCYYANTDAVIYVVDSADRDRIGISKQELLSMLEVSDNEIHASP